MRLAKLDILRGVAIILVIGRHNLLIPDQLPEFIRYPLLFWRWIGWCGVDLFFVLSGFLISGLLFKEYEIHGNIRSLYFLIRRGFKIYPNYYLMILVSAIIAFFYSFPTPFDNRQFLGELLFIQNYYDRFWLHTWSLAVEEHFYLLLVLLLAYSAKKGAVGPFNFVPYITLVTAIICLAGRYFETWLASGVENGWTFAYSRSHNRIDCLFVGVGLCWAYRYRTAFIERYARRFRHYFLLLFVSCLVLPFYYGLDVKNWEFTAVFGIALTGVAAGTLLMLTITDAYRLPVILNKLLSPLGAVGRLSYTIYLWNPMVYEVFEHFYKSSYSSGSHTFTTGSYIIFLTLAVLGSIFVGLFFNRVIEIPLLRVRDRYWPSRSTSPQ
jgi:peptidoglycan/LPS O-acetylase OafA/YrhL